MAGPLCCRYSALVAAAALGLGSAVLHASRRVLAHLAAVRGPWPTNRWQDVSAFQHQVFRCSVVSVSLDPTDTFFLPRMRYTMKRRRRLEQMEQALHTANRKTDHHFIQDFLAMLESLQMPKL